MRHAWIHPQDDLVDRSDAEQKHDAPVWLIWLLISTGLLAYSQIQLQFPPDSDQSTQGFAAPMPTPQTLVRDAKMRLARLPPPNGDQG